MPIRGSQSHPDTDIVTHDDGVARRRRQSVVAARQGTFLFARVCVCWLASERRSLGPRQARDDSRFVIRGHKRVAAVALGTTMMYDVCIEGGEGSRNAPNYPYKHFIDFADRDGKIKGRKIQTRRRHTYGRYL